MRVLRYKPVVTVTRLQAGCFRLNYELEQSPSFEHLLDRGIMLTRKGSQVAFWFGILTAMALTGIILYVLIADFSWEQSLLLTIGCLIVLWAIIFSFFEIGRLSRGAKRIRGHESGVDPDAPRTVVVDPPTGHPYPHHEMIPGSSGFDQGQLTSYGRDQTPTLRDWVHWGRHKRKAS